MLTLLSYYSVLRLVLLIFRGNLQPAPLNYLSERSNMSLFSKTLTTSKRHDVLTQKFSILIISHTKFQISLWVLSNMCCVCSYVRHFQLLQVCLQFFRILSLVWCAQMILPGNSHYKKYLYHSAGHTPLSETLAIRYLLSIIWGYRGTAYNVRHVWKHIRSCPQYEVCSK